MVLMADAGVATNDTESYSWGDNRSCSGRSYLCPSDWNDRRGICRTGLGLTEGCIVDKDSVEDIEEIIDFALKDSWKYRDLGWSAIGPICERLDLNDSLEEQRAVISLMYANTHSAKGRNLAPSNLPVDRVCRCLQMQSNSYEDAGQEMVRTSLLSEGVRLLGHMNDPIAIDTLIFIDTGENRWVSSPRSHRRIG